MAEQSLICFVREFCIADKDEIRNLNLSRKFVTESSKVRENLLVDVHQFSLHLMCECENKIEICEVTVHEFKCFTFLYDSGYKHSGIIRFLFKALAGIRDMTVVYSKPFSETEALDKLIETALSYRKFLNKKQEQL